MENTIHIKSLSENNRKYKIQKRPRGLKWLSLCAMLFALCSYAEAQPRKIIPRVGVLELNSRERPTPALPSFRKGLRDLGYVEGQNILLDYRYADGKADRFPALAAELVQLAPDVLWLHTNPAARSAKRATTTIPIVVAVSIGLVENGLVASLAQPGGNLTGLELPAGRVSGRRLELLKESLPTISRVAVLVDPGWQGRAGVLSDIEREARALGIKLQPVQASSAANFDAAFAGMVHGKADALMFMKSALFAVNRRQLAALALRHRLPTMSFALPFAEEGSLLAYGADPREMSHRSAVFVHKILQGIKPADLPIERAAPKLVINLRTAKQLGITIPPTVLFQANKVIK